MKYYWLGLPAILIIATVLVWRRGTLASHLGGQLILGRGQAETARNRAYNAKCEDLVRRAGLAGSRGDYFGEERLYLQAKKLTPFASIELSSLYDKHGKYALALDEYNVMVGWSGSYKTDAWLQVRRGDLAMLYGTKSLARDAYLAAAKQPTSYRDRTFSPLGSGTELSDASTMDLLRANAYYSAGMYYLQAGSRDRDKARRYLELAMTLEPKSALMRWGYARSIPKSNGGWKLVMAEDWSAEQEATGPLKEAIHRWRGQHNEVNWSNKVEIKNGVVTQTATEYKPTGTAPTPRVPDPVALHRVDLMIVPGQVDRFDAPANKNPVP